MDRGWKEVGKRLERYWKDGPGPLAAVLGPGCLRTGAGETKRATERKRT
jgi:hypothetical protein